MCFGVACCSMYARTRLIGARPHDAVKYEGDRSTHCAGTHQSDYTAQRIAPYETPSFREGRMSRVGISARNLESG